MTAQDIDTRSDIYSLGVLLYELLIGALPFDSKTLRRAGYAEIQRIIREQDPSKPSTRLSSLASEPSAAGGSGSGGTDKDVAKSRQTDFKSLLKHIRGDLDWIVLKAMEKDRARRYETANGLAADIKRHLNHEPVAAGPPGAGYKMSKFIRRNRAGVIAATIMLLILLGGIAGTTTGMVRAFRAEQATKIEAAKTERERDNAKAVNDFLNDDLLAAVAPAAKAGKGKDVLMRDVLDIASEKIEDASRSGGKFSDKPLIEASIRNTLGVTYWKLGEFPVAEPHLERTRELYLRELGEEHPSTLNSMNNLAILYKEQGRYDEAEPLYVKTLEIQKRIRGEEHPNTLMSMNSLAILYWNQGRYDEAEPLYVKTLEIRKRILGDEHTSTLNTMNNLAILYKDQGRYDEAEPLYIKTLETQKRILGEEHPHTLRSMGNLAILYWNQGRYDEADPLNVKTLETQKRILGDEHPNTLMSMNSLAILYWNQGRYNEAEPLYVKTLEIRKRILGDEHPSTLNSMGNLANLYNDQGRYDEAEPLYVKTLEIQKRILGDEHPSALISMMNLAELYVQLERYEDAEALQVQAVEASHRAWPDGAWFIGAFRGNHGRTLLKLHRYQAAEEALVEAYEILMGSVGSENEQTKKAVESFVELYEAWDKPDQAETWRAKLPTEVP